MLGWKNKPQHFFAKKNALIENKRKKLNKKLFWKDKNKIIRIKDEKRKIKYD